MKGYTQMGAELTPEVQALLAAGLNEPLVELGNFAVLWFADSRGPKVVLLYNHYLKPNIAIHVVARPGALWCFPDILYHVFNYPFTQLECARVTAPIKSINLASIRTVKALGFVYEGSLRRAGRSGEDLLLYGMLREECRWLNERKAA